ncbi:protein jag [Acidipropionibacterium virtanenii]|uniref:R3H domain-containing protein n=1 Tax=Acidipropionibacterium virtanenii TaxID=2057246 RepID=A0A344UYD4_9ACTN|nr:R3H domain-containing nucleic acid-binding protein [Acidipropionibacterium virtanenii]AXE40282.1 hypothetical protein JS278_03148 [Acidipropionibacterium virtanenii]
MSEESVDNVVDGDVPVAAVEEVAESVPQREDENPEAVEDSQEADSDGGDTVEEDADEGDADSVEEDSGEDVDPLEEEGDIAADYLEELLDIADLDGDIDTYVEGSRAHISIVTESQTLVGPGGRVLEALQELARLSVMTETGHRSRLMLDVAGYRETRRKELLILATEAIESVKETGEPAHLTPMNPFERKIVHDAAAAAGLVSESEGVEPKRHVVISTD